MPMSPLRAWTIFSSAQQGQEQGINAIAALMLTEWVEYQTHAEQFDLDLAEKVLEVQNEGAALLTNSPVALMLETKPAHRYTAADYKELVGIFEGSKYELLHLSAFFRIQNTDLLLELVKPSA